MFKKAYSRSLLLNLFITVITLVYALMMSYLLFYRHRYIGDGFVYNLVPFQTIKRYIVHHDHFNFEIWFKNLFGNIVLFIPIGVFLPLLNTKYRRVSALTGATIIMIAVVELIQLLSRVGSFDIDDIILNSLGALLGLMMTKVLFRTSS
ncbi:VanZ family protein [Paenibacillus prosopidis]|uniref:VanZ like protein n=1 Tax=Paenibacillus prosopidis TaxID=630520 RepID=A0A368VW59_9BACL|nr:VanZ family protein [Paenibacillus prosopidis]RCW44923.1 VanZ like protein [Paenibacillus prosopidis]